MKKEAWHIIGVLNLIGLIYTASMWLLLDFSPWMMTLVPLGTVMVLILHVILPKDDTL